MTYLVIAVALFFAMNIGASGAAATMGVAYGSGALRKLAALILVGIGVFLGAYFGGGEVVKTLGSGIIPTDLLSIPIVLIILIGAAGTLFLANLLGIPLSTSEVTVGSVVGVGVAYQVLYVKSLLVIVSFWLIIPLLAFGISWVAGHLIRRLEQRDARWRGEGSRGWRRTLMLLVIGAGFVEAISAGMNNVANAVGPLVGAGLMSTEDGILWGGLFVALGALLLGGRVLETNGKKITQLSLLQGTAISGTGGSLVIAASLFGIPVPLTQVTTTAIMGIGAVNQGMKVWQKGIVLKILKVWLVSPLLSLVVSFTLVKIFVDPEPYQVVVMTAGLIALIGLKSLYNSAQAEKRTVHEEGGGI
ncbi:anion permease [Xylanibacillus composti]|uniref:Sulfate permease CysP n=1 Tax=Xylanibacillus composti TaxID=1572762 RepID=A0A8J4GYL8_9BACL|nr:inorganic phosphate transporter [Xylanibacillus composti]MDT9725757.1 anion permease [Xylanibacillus composti]GIQ67529.1 sulfate permease CysP [Xylanibacillus composti]